MIAEMTDPDAVKNEPQEQAPPPQPPRPAGRQQMSQMEADELYARQLAQHYDNVGAYEARTSSRGRENPSRDRRHQGDSPEREYSFIDDDLPAIRENLRQGFVETQTKVNGWINTMRQRIEATFDESEENHPQSSSQRHAEPSRRSGDYDADPQVLSDDFAGMRFGPDGSKYQFSTSGFYLSLWGLGS